MLTGLLSLSAAAASSEQRLGCSKPGLVGWVPQIFLVRDQPTAAQLQGELSFFFDGPRGRISTAVTSGLEIFGGSESEATLFRKVLVAMHDEAEFARERKDKANSDN